MNDGGRYRRVRSRLWREQKFLELAEGERLVALYCSTGPQMNSLGLADFSLARGAEDFNCSLDTFRRRFTAVCRAFGWRHDTASRVLWIPEWLSENPPQSPNVCKSWRAAFNEIPDCRLKTEAGSFIEGFLKAKGQAFSEAFGEAFTDGSGHPSRNQDTYQETSQEQETAAATGTSGKQQQPDVDRFLKKFTDLYLQLRNTAYIERDGDREIVAALLRPYGSAQLEAMAELLLRVGADVDRWIAESDRSIAVLKHRAAWLNERLRSSGFKQRPRFCRGGHQPPCLDEAECTKRRMADSRRIPDEESVQSIGVRAS